MNPNTLTRELRKLPGNIKSPKLPGGTLISAVLDRRLMTWSDRGGASRIFGELWSEHCWVHLNNGATIFEVEPIDLDQANIIRLDDIPKIALQAGRNQLPNPDFLVIHRSTASDTLSVRAIDAKFAVDRLRRIQISPESIRDLINLPGSHARAAIDARIGPGTSDRLQYESGAFLGPNSLLNDYFFERHTTGTKPEIPAGEIHLITVGADTLFSPIEEYRLMELLQSIDAITASEPESELVIGMYYLRLATAARWFANQSQLPLLSASEPEPVAVGEVHEELHRRISAGESAFGLIETWSRTAEKQVERQKLVQDAARLPVRMSEIRRLLEQRGLGEEKKLIRRLRGMLEVAFRPLLIERTGEIPATPDQSLQRTIDLVSGASRSLRPEVQQTAIDFADQLASEVSNSENALEQVTD
jgi:hypothetical protein